MLRIMLDLMYDNDLEAEVDTVCNIIESHLTVLQKNQIFLEYGKAMQTLNDRKPKPLTADGIAAKFPTFCEGCEE